MLNMKWTVPVAAVISAIVGIGAVAAADLPAKPVYTKAAPMPVAIYDWSGFYVGVNGGGGSDRSCWDLLNFLGDPVPSARSREGCHNATGGSGGGQVGYRWQRASWVFGLEAQGNWANLRGQNGDLFQSSLVTDRSKVDAFGLFTGQVGYAWNNVLLYVKGGAAVTSEKYDSFTNVTSPPGGGGAPAIPAGLVTDQASESRWGGVLGVGGEYAFSQNWSVGLEYDHVFMGTRAISFASTGNPFSPTPGAIYRVSNIHQDLDLITVRLNYRFGGPVVARY
jgi:outer membrane immunogenic protein